MTTSVDDAMLARREALVTALHEELRDVLNIARITAVVDRALDVAGVQLALETVVAADVAINAYAAVTPVPPPAVVTAVGGYQDQGTTFNGHYGGEFVSEP